jgi:hypothetical protein
VPETLERPGSLNLDVQVRDDRISGVLRWAMNNRTVRGGAWAAVVLATVWGATWARAWNDSGHTTIGVIVYRELSPAARARVDELLRAHPRYEEDLLRGYTGAKDDAAAKAEYAFAKAGTWPDMVRNRDNPAWAVHHKGNWHYTDVPFYPFGGEDKFKGEPARPAKPGEPYDSISAWEFNLARLHDEALPAADRAVALCWVLHIGGDSHQPCHNTSLYAETHPTGDRGANEWILMYRGERRNLHSLWDGWIGDDRTIEFARQRATEITEKHPRSVLAGEAAKMDIREWVKEGARLAIESVYLWGMIDALPKAVADADPSKVPPTVTQAYAAQATELSLRRAALGAYRTAAAIEGQ